MTYLALLSGEHESLLRDFGTYVPLGKTLQTLQLTRSRPQGDVSNNDA